MNDHGGTRPFARPPDPNAILLTQAEALAKARRGNADAPAHALLVPYREVTAANTLGSNWTVHPDRMVWAVTVHADIMTRGSIATPSQLVHVYSLIIDAETGGVPGFAWGIEVVRDGQLVVVPRQRGLDLSHDPTAGPQGPHPWGAAEELDRLHGELSIVHQIAELVLSWIGDAVRRERVERQKVALEDIGYTVRVMQAEMRGAEMPPEIPEQRASKCLGHAHGHASGMYVATLNGALTLLVEMLSIARHQAQHTEQIIPDRQAELRAVVSKLERFETMVTEMRDEMGPKG